jgi:mono/diheme cytochrome c family protein
MRCTVLFLCLFLPLAFAGCAGEPETESAQPPDTLTAVAMEAYDASMFDSITWNTEQDALDRGLTVYRHSCARCHGTEGRGDAGFVRAGDTLRPESFLREDWPYTDDKASLRQQVFVGTAEGMPHWGLEGLRPRDVDAVAIYIMQVLRKS